MRYYKLLPLPFLMMGIHNFAYADHVYLPTISVEGIAAEDTPYILPSARTSSPDTGDLIKQLPGVNVNRNGAITSIPQYRGLFGERVNVLIDGVRLHEAGPNSMDSALNYLPASRVENVSIYRGIAPVSTGIETIGGTLTANSKKIDFGSSHDTEFHGDVTAGYASNGHTLYFGLTAGVTNQHHRFQVTGSNDRGNDLDFDDGDIEPTKHERDSLGMSYAFQHSGNNIELDIEHHDTGHTGTPSLPMDIIYIRGENYKTVLSHQLNNGAILKGQLHYQDIDHQMDNFTLRNTPDPMQRFVSPKLKASDLSLSYSQESWTFGLDLDQAKHNATVFNPNMAAFFVNSFKDVERDRYSVFAEWSGQLADDWKMDAGLRYSLVKMDADDVDSFAGLPAAVGLLRNRFNNEDRSKSEDLVDIVANVIHNLSDELDFEIGFARKTRAPSYQERYLWIPLEITAGLADGNNYIGDINLAPEVAYQFELGLDWHTQKAAISPRIFYHSINNYIQGVANITDTPTIGVSTVNGDATPLRYTNVDAKLYGIDANWFVVFSQQWQLDGTASYVRGKRRDTNDNLYRIAPLRARTMLSYNQSNWKVGIEAETVARQNNVSDENNEQKTSSYALFNLSGNYQPTQNIMLTAGVNNLFDRNYENHLGGYNRISNNPDIAQGDRLPGIGRSAYLGVNINW